MAELKCIKWVLALLLLTAYNHGALSQSSLTFIVKDGNTEKAVEYANVLLVPCYCGGVTDMNGAFSIELETDQKQVIVSYIGYRTDTLALDMESETNYTLLLSSDGVLLDNVTVSASDNRRNLDKTVMGVQQLSIEKIKSLPTAIGEVDILKSLTMLPGVGSAGEASNGLSVRGGSLDQNLVLLDQAPVYNTTHLFGLFSIFTPEAVRGVELYQANMPAKYGGRISSIVDVKMKNPELSKFHMDGGVGLVSNRLALNVPVVKGKLGFLVAGRASYNDFLLRQFKKLKNTKANFVDGTFKIRYQPNDNNSFYVTTFYSRDFYQLDLNEKVNNIPADANQYDYATFNNTITWVKKLGARSFLTSSMVTSNYNPSILFPQSEIDNVTTYSSRIQNQGLKVDYTNKVSELIDFSSGVDISRTELQPGEISSTNDSGIGDLVLNSELAVEAAAYVHADFNFSENLSLSTGLRYTYYTLLGPYEEAIYKDDNKRDVTETIVYGGGEQVKSYHYPEPRVGLRWKLTDKNSLKWSYALTRQYLQNIYNSTTPLPTSRWKVSDTYILPQTGHTFSMGYYQNFFNNAVTLGLETYYRDIANVIDYKPGADFFLQEFIEKDVVQGRGQNYGVELSLEKSAGKFNGWCNYTYSRSLRRFESELLGDRINNNEWFASDFDRPHVFNGTFNFEANEFNTFSFNFTYQQGRPYTVPSAVIKTEGLNIPIFLNRNNSRIPDYHRLDFSWRIHNITTKKTRWKGDWIFTLYNLYNRNNAFNVFFSSKDLGPPGSPRGSGPLSAYQLSIFSTTIVSLGYNFHFE